MPRDLSKMSEKEKALRKKLNIPMGAELTLLELEPDIEVLTEGWTDEQIRNKSAADFDQMISSAELGIDKMEETIMGERKRIRSLRKLRARRLELEN
jgi:hypothetical protein